MSAELTTELSDVVDAGVERGRVETRTAIPGTIVAFKSGPPESCKVQPNLRRVTNDGVEVTMPQVDEAPIVWPGAAGWTVSTDLKRGDEVVCLVADRAIDAWLQQGGTVTPRDGRLHDPTDIIVIPGLRSNKTATRVVRGRNTLYIGSDNGSAPWMRLKSGAGAAATIEAPQINLGQGAGLGVARQTDKVTVTPLQTDWLAWFNALGALIMTPPPVGSPIAQITTASSKVKSE